MYGVLLGIHLVVCLTLVCVILIQSGKGGGLAGGAFGGATQTVFGGRGATDFITRATIVLGVTFFVTSMALALMTTRGTAGGGAKSLLQEQARKASQSAPGQLPTGAPPRGTGPATAPITVPAPAASPAGKPAPTGATPAPSGGH